MKKRVLMSLVVLAIIGTSAIFAQQPTLDKLTFILNADKQSYRATAKDSNISGEVVIPATYNNLPVTGIDLFSGCREMTSITLPASVVEISSQKFSPSSKLTSVTFLGSNTKVASNVILGTDLDIAYKANGAGTYTRQAGGKNWRKGGTVCPTCGGTGYI